MQAFIVQWFLPIVCTLLEAAIVIALMRSKLRARFPMLLAYLAACVAGFIVVIGASRMSGAIFFYAYWSFTTILVILGFVVLHEVFFNGLKDYPAVIDLGKLLFRGAGVFLLLTAVLTAFSTKGPETTKICAAITHLYQSVQMMQAGLALFLVLFESRLGISWRSYNMAICLGLGISSAASLLAVYMTPKFTSWVPLIDGGETLIHAAVLTFWLVNLYLPQPEHSKAADAPSRLIIQRWNEALSGYGYGQPAYAVSGVDSFIPGVEQVVDRVMARKIM